MSVSKKPHDFTSLEIKGDNSHAELIPFGGYGVEGKFTISIFMMGNINNDNIITLWDWKLYKIRVRLKNVVMIKTHFIIKKQVLYNIAWMKNLAYRLLLSNTMNMIVFKYTYYTLIHILMTL